MQTPPIFQKYRDDITTEMESVLADNPTPLHGMMRYHLGWVDSQGNPVKSATGKLIRPTLCLLACEAIGGDYRQALPAAAAVELVHNFSLIHDDIQDDDRERHHRPTVWAIWGKPQAINAGTTMRILANQALLRLAERGVRSEKLVRACALLDQCTLQLLEGQFLDISFEGRLDVTTEDYLEMVAGKTAALIASALQLGGMLCRAQEQTILALHRFGVALGLAFQITDDFLGIWGEPGNTGKSNGSDILRKKKSYPVVYALENTHGKVHGELERIYRQAVVDASMVDTVLEILDSAGARRQTQRAADAYIDQARQELDALNLNAWGRGNLDEVVAFFANRDY